jgi:hypothetical protein
MKVFQKDNKIKTLNRIVIIKDNMQIFNPTEEMILEDGWVEYIPVVQEPTEEELFNLEKEHMINRIMDFDNSDEVNNCYINYQGQQISYWADKQERSVLKTAIQDCITLGRENYRLDLRDLDVSIELNCELLLQMLASLEVYAIDCYNVTTDHLFNIKKIETLEELHQYDYRAGYPEKLVFSV